MRGKRRVFAWRGVCMGETCKAAYALSQAWRAAAVSAQSSSPSLAKMPLIIFHRIMAFDY